MDQQTLSLVAQYDDLMRFCGTFLNGDLIEEKVKLLIENCEQKRHYMLHERSELIQLKEQIKNLKKENHTLETVLKNVREEFTNQVNLKEKYKQERDSLLKKINLIQSFLLEEDKENKTDVKERILTSINFNKLEPIVEQQSVSTHDSLSDIEFDKTEDDLIGDGIGTKRKSTTMENNFTQSPTKKKVQNELVEDYDILEELEKEDRFEVNSLPKIEYKIDNRPHQFVTKKSIKPEKCGPCGQSITFMSTGYHCRDCRAVCHMGCKDKVPLPCIPYVSRANIGKHGKLVLISDFVQLNCRPCIPALIVHCCSEIEKRGLEEIGPYRIAGSMKDIMELKKLFANTKKGIPNLSKVDIYVLCDVVKGFLKDLDESLITKLAWRDFVTGTSLKDEKERENYLCDLITSLHVANRDTLAYIILHLHKIASSPGCKMPKSNLAKIFGPTIVGYSMRNPLSDQIREETMKQISVMEALLNIDIEFWKNLISNKSSVPIIRKNSINELIGNLNFGSHSSSKLDGNYNNYSNSRMSIGSRLCGGRVASGTLTPLKSFNLRNNSNKTSFKPLF